MNPIPFLFLLLLLHLSLLSRAALLPHRSHQNLPNPTAKPKASPHPVTGSSKHVIFLKSGFHTRTVDSPLDFPGPIQPLTPPSIEVSLESGPTVLTAWKVLTPSNTATSPGTDFNVRIETSFDAFPGKAVLLVRVIHNGFIRTYRHNFVVIGLVIYDHRAQPARFYTGKSAKALSLRRKPASPKYIELHTVVFPGLSDSPDQSLQKTDLSFILPSYAPISWDAKSCKIIAAPTELRRECAMAFSAQFDRFYILIPEDPAIGTDDIVANIQIVWKGFRQLYQQIGAEVGLTIPSANNKDITNDNVTTLRVNWDVESGGVPGWKVALIVIPTVGLLCVAILMSCWCCVKRKSMSDIARLQKEEIADTSQESQGENTTTYLDSFTVRLRDSVRTLLGTDSSGKSGQGNMKGDTPRPKMHGRPMDVDEFSMGDTLALPRMEEDDMGFGSGGNYVEPIDVPRERRGVAEADLIEPSESLAKAQVTDQAILENARKARNGHGEDGGGGGDGILTRNFRELGEVIEQEHSYFHDRMQKLNMLQGPATRGIVGRFGERLEPVSSEASKTSNTVRYQLSIPQLHQGNSNYGKLVK